jgi:hypothetical protein
MAGTYDEQGETVPLPQLRRVRWAVRATLTLGVAASVVANVLHAQDNPISQAIAAWPPLALLLTVELISRVPVHRRFLAVARLAATATIAGIAAWVSYWHMAGVAARYGETGTSPYLLPLSVDGLIVVASICLVELGGRISAAGTGTGMVAAPQLRSTDAARIRLAAVLGAPPSTSGKRRPGVGTERSVPRSTTAPAMETRRAGANGRKPATERTGRTRRPVAETAALAAAIEADRPSVSEAEVARELGISTTRLRAVRRQVRDLELAA